MDDNQKPFACTIEGCDMTFTNEDHLNWHHKKHDMVLNLGLANKNIEVADQTPTPTRFIRNCEEVGLFQDLQNVNPFDETFKKAIECVKSGTLLVPEIANSDDTLHTPHIFPPVESSSVKYSDIRSDNHTNQLDDFCVNSVPSTEDNDLTIVVDEPDKDKLKNTSIDLKSKLKETIKNKCKTPITIETVPLDKLRLTENESTKRPLNGEDINNKKQKTNEGVSDQVAKIRELNRAAQLRCRKRKKIMWKKMEDDLKVLKNENAKLVQENQNFKQKFYALKEVLLNHKNDVTSNSTHLLTRIEDILNSPIVLVRKSTPVPVIKHKLIQNKIPITQSPIVPVSVAQAQADAVQKPVLIQVMGPVAQLAVSVLPNK